MTYTLININIQRILRFSCIFGLAILTILSACQPKLETDLEVSISEISIGYCPTMAPYVQNLAETYTNLTLTRFDNSARALQALQAGQVQAVLIGRIAWQNELSESLRLVRLADGLTLIARQPGFIAYEDLSRLNILTTERESAAQSLLPDEAVVTYYSDFDQMMADLDASAGVLLRWSQVTPVDSLLTPVYGTGNKMPSFRSPHFYYLAPMEEKLAPLLTTFSANQ